MTAEGVEAAITPRTRALMLVHIYGLPVDLDPIMAIAKKHDLRVIEDAAQMHGQTYRGRPCGNFADIERALGLRQQARYDRRGGMIMADDGRTIDRLRSLRNLCFQSEERFVHDELGWNARMTNLQAALGVAQMERLDNTIEIKRQMGRLYNELLKDIEVIQCPVARTNYAENIYWAYGIVLNEEVKFDARASHMRRLAEKGIGTRPFFWCMHEQPVLRARGFFANVSLPNAERLARRGFYLPSGTALTEAQITRSAEALREILV